jgi:hypothetical protein
MDIYKLQVWVLSSAVSKIYSRWIFTDMEERESCDMLFVADQKRGQGGVTDNIFPVTNLISLCSSVGS